MKIIVCIKQVPGTTNVALDPETGTMKRDGTRGRLNPFDLFAIEQALQLRESYGGTVTVLSMGPTQAETSLKEALYMGADDAYLICDKAMIGSDVLATSRAISQAIQYIGNPDLVLCGKQTIDGDTAQVGPEVAEMLDIPHLTNVVCFEKYEKEKMTVVSALEQGESTYRLKLPFLACMEKDSNTPRLPSYRCMKAMAACAVKRINLDDFTDRDPSHYGISGSATRVERIFAPERGKIRSFCEGDAQAMAQAFINVLKQEKIV